MDKTIKDLGILASLVLGLTFLLWLPHLLLIHSFFNLDFSAGFNTIYRNFDGLEYVTIAKSFYFRTPIYFASHFPLYPIFIFLFSNLLGFLKSMLFVSILFTILASWAFYILVKRFNLTKYPVWLSIVFLTLPGRWLIVHSVPSPEPIFIFFLITSIYFFLEFEQSAKKSSIWLASFAGLFAQLTRPPGILLFIGFWAYIHWNLLQKTKTLGLKKAVWDHLKYWPLILIPLGMLGIFYMFGIVYGDFFAYFHSGDNVHLFFPPFQVFNKHQFWVGDIWLEDIVYIFLLGFLGGLTLIKQKLYPLGFFVLTYLVASTLVVHRDVSRYTLPIMPFVIIAFEKVLVSREFKIVLAIVGLGIYLYAQNYIINNIAPVPNLELFN